MPPARPICVRPSPREAGALVNTEYCSIHPESDDYPHNGARLWDESPQDRDRRHEQHCQHADGVADVAERAAPFPQGSGYRRTGRLACGGEPVADDRGRLGADAGWEGLG